MLILSSSGAGKTALQDAALALLPAGRPRETHEPFRQGALLQGATILASTRCWRWRKATGRRKRPTRFAISSAPGNWSSSRPSKTWPPARLTTMENKVEGPTAVFITTTDPGDRPGDPQPVLCHLDRREPGADAQDTFLSAAAARRSTASHDAASRSDLEASTGTFSGS